MTARARKATAAATAPTTPPALPVAAPTAGQPGRLDLATLAAGAAVTEAPTRAGRGSGGVFDPLIARSITEGGVWFALPAVATEKMAATVRNALRRAGTRKDATVSVQVTRNEAGFVVNFKATTNGAVKA